LVPDDCTEPNGEEPVLRMGWTGLYFVENLFKDWKTPFCIVATQTAIYHVHFPAIVIYTSCQTLRIPRSKLEMHTCQFLREPPGFPSTCGHNQNEVQLNHN
jgi:hypothetical protein